MSHSDDAKRRIGAASRARASAEKALRARWANRQTECKIDGCNKPHEAKGYCNMHYIRFRKTGDPGKAGKIGGENGHVSYYGYVHKSKKSEHVEVAERALGKPLPAGAVVHHVNEDKADNRNENLVICQDKAYHNLIHARMRALEACGNAEWLLCPFCGKYDSPANLYVYPNRRAAKHRECYQRYKEERNDR